MRTIFKLHSPNLITKASTIVKHIKFDIRLRTISIKNIANDSVNSLLCHN